MPKGRFDDLVKARPLAENGEGAGYFEDRDPQGTEVHWRWLLRHWEWAADLEEARERRTKG